MKKIFLIGLAAAAMLTGCNQDETLEMAKKDGAISFSPYVGKATRTQIINNGNMQPFHVYGWRTATAGGNAELLFDGQTVQVDGSYTPLKYWETGYKYQFEAIYPKNGESGVAMTTNVGGSTIEYTNDGTKDLVYARSAEKTVTTPDDFTAVGLNFVHLLSRIRFKAKNTFDNNSAMRVTIEKIEILNCTKKATITPGTITEKYVTGIWGGKTGSYDLQFIKQQSPSNGSVANDGDDLSNKVLIPGDAIGVSSEAKFVFPGAAGDRTIRVTFSVKQLVSGDENGGTAVYTTPIEYVKDFSLSLAENNLNQGNAYAIMLSIGSQAAGDLVPIKFTVDVETWEANATDIEVVTNE